MRTPMSSPPHVVEGVGDAVGSAFSGEGIVELARKARDGFAFDYGLEDIGIAGEALQHDELFVEAEDGDGDSARGILYVLQ